MAKFTTAQVKECARALLENNPKGLRWAELFKAVSAAGPETPPGTIQGSLRALRVDDNEIVRPTKGLWVLAKYYGASKTLDSSEPPPASGKLSKVAPESEFYQPFADWLRDDAEEVVEALALGGATFKWKWGTPDVIGVNKPRPSDAVRFLPTEIVAAEIKVDSSQAITAFGQACAYRLFAHKTYIVMPETLPQEDRDRLETLCGLFGIGFVEFSTSPKSLAFEMRVRAQRFEPDRFYVNKIAEMLKDFSLEDFNRLF
ncbi:MAG: hypothetical protein HYR63_23665 [Proteobacteria bacterium]|nr:hypothetical protein [Pseudomonadota bacterium]